ncbi:major facilitator transporter [Pandoraea pnomenusa 3kgm]|uniref:MFS transporter n=1 Tax=Pandoraea TaxID=93217 RepID=UPI0004375D53|nr:MULTISPECIES: MFS transporter [Pandoraea]AHB04875.2 major facilitator transporter [Pandoraea pnomenusa 3kgm]AHN76903.1 MFS transporter [Pandoraea pnomenusa]
MPPSTPASAAVTGTRSSVRWKIFLMMLLLITINYVDRASLSVAMPLISKEFDLTPAMEGLILSSFFWTYAFMQIPGGMLADKYKPRIVIATATVLWGAFQAMAALCTNSTALLLTRLGLGAAEAPIYPAGGKLNAIWMTKNERGRGAALLDGGSPLGAALGAVIITWLIATLGSWRLAFVVAGVGTVLAGAVAWRYIRNTPREHPAINELEVRFIEEAQAAESGAEPANISGRTLDFFKYRSVWCMTSGQMCFNVVYYGLLTWMPSYLNKVHGFDLKSMGGASFIIFFSGFVGEQIGGWITDKWKDAGGRPNVVMRTIFGVAAALTTISIFSVAYVSNSIAIVVLLSSTLFFLRWCGLFWCIPSMIGTRNKVGFLGGLMNLGGNISGIAVPVIVGLIVQFTGSYFLALMLFAAGGVGLLLSALSINYEKKIPV